MAAAHVFPWEWDVATDRLGWAVSPEALLGLPRDYINSQLGAWTTAQRRAQAPDCMAQIARLLTSEDVSAVSAWLSAQPLPGNGHPAASLPAQAPLRCGTLEGER